MDKTPWILLDTETTGRKAPIYVVELAAQRMRGWAPEGSPFRRMLNHGVAIPPGATAFTRIPLRPSSLAHTLVMPITPDLVAT